jgi:Saxitoxin biosynthesis operon protein SxtJ
LPQEFAFEVNSALACFCLARYSEIGVTFKHLESTSGSYMAHESLHRDEVIHPSSNRAFGFVFAGVFALIGAMPLAWGHGMRMWSLVVGAVFLAVALALPATLGPLNRVWLRFGLLLHRVVSPIVLGIMFFLVVTPLGVAMRAFGKDLLRLRYDRQASTYWIDRRPPGPPPDSFDHQF